jgi:hypothetical protein
MEPMTLWRVLCLSAIHFALWYSSAIVGYGTDLDQLRGRSWLADSAATLCAALQYPHDVALHAVPTAWLGWAAIVLIVLNSLLWGAGLAGAWQLAKMAGSTQGRP